MVRIKIKTKENPSTICSCKNHSLLIKRKLLITMVLFIAFVSFSYAQISDTLTFADNKSSRLKYLKSIAIEEQEKCEKATFLEKFNIDLTSFKEAKIVKDMRFKKEPSDTAENCKSVIPSGSIVKLFNFYPNEKYWAVKYENKWGFLPDKSVKCFD
ncbi:MAG: hypothetical protein R2750_08985 [Bacteroidales bacterium]